MLAVFRDDVGTAIAAKEAGQDPADAQAQAT
jgi:hypothetical protein